LASVNAQPKSTGGARSGALLDWLLEPPAPWQMKFGERCALEGLLSLLKPELSIEVGTAQGGSLHRIAEHSREVHSFDIVPEVAELGERFPNVEFHIGDSATLLPEVLGQLADSGSHVDFAFVDGDHTAEGVERNARALLEADACGQTVIVFHDAANDDVRAGIDALGLADHPRVALALLDFVPGYVVENGPRRFEIWNGLALVVLDEHRRGNSAFVDSEVYDAAALNRRVRDQLRGGVSDHEQEAETAAASPAELDLSGASGDGIPERFIPDQMGEGVVAAEHLGRYWWAAQFAEGRRVLDAGCGIGYGANMLAAAGAAEVTGVDIAEPVIEAAREGAASGVVLKTGDVANLDFPADSFELVVCFEVIEHVDDTDAVLDELARVLAPGGVLLISSPNRDRYVPGNPHHRYEFTPDELRTALGNRFREVRLLRQHDWLSSAILEDDSFATSGADPLDGVQVRKLVGHPPGAETYTLALASETELPASLMPLTLTHSMELRDWMEHFQAQERTERARADELTRLETLDQERRALRKRLEEAELKLASIPDMEIAVEQAQRLHEGAGRALEDVMSSPSWRITAPLRKAKELAARMRSG
jgi:2-polyprenyl-3-methyl-5-hydroxy-6-metoxy-1,4-benzoquinol methylase